MNCPNCGAAMKLREGRGYFACDYCATFHFLETSPQGTDRISLIDRQADLLCPVCRSPLTMGAAEEREVLICRHCRGILTTNGSFAEIVKARRKARRQAGEDPEESPPLVPVELQRNLDCPSCGRTMDVHPYYGPGNVVVDTCPRCVLIWLDPGELSVIEKAP